METELLWCPWNVSQYCMLDKCIHYYGHLTHFGQRFGSLRASFRSVCTFFRSIRAAQTLLEKALSELECQHLTYDTEKYFAGTTAVRSPLNSSQAQPLKATDWDCISSWFVIELPKLIDMLHLQKLNK